MKKRWFAGLRKSLPMPVISLVAFFFLIGMLVGVVLFSWMVSGIVDYNKIYYLKKEIKENYLYDYEEADLDEGMYQGMLRTLGDRYSQYYIPKEWEDYETSHSSTTVGIGAQVQQSESAGFIEITRVYPGGPGEKAGLQKGDLFLAVNGTSVTGISVETLVQDHVKGEAGAKVQITVRRPATGEELSFHIERAETPVPSVFSQLLADKTGYIRVESFLENTGDLFCEAVDALLAQEMVRLIVDVRGNRGGSMNAAVQMIDYLLPDKTGSEKNLIVYTQNKQGTQIKYYCEDGKSIAIPLAVLQDKNSASASELFAGAVKDYGLGLIVGSTSYGKGIVQTVYTLENGTGFRLTSSEYFTPKGNALHGVGVFPDLAVKREEAVTTSTAVEALIADNVTQAAIAALTS